MTADRYRYFRIEASELVEGLSQGLLELEQRGGSPEALDRLFRLAHTLKGAARVVGLASVAESAHALEDLLVPYRQAGAPASRELADAALAIVDAVAGEIAALAPAPAEPARAQPEEGFETVRVDVLALETLMAGLTEARSQFDGLHRQVEALRHAGRLADELAQALAPSPEALAKAEALATALARLERGMGTSVDRAEDELAIAHERLNRMRLIPVSAVFSQLERSARDAASQLGKRVEFAASGGETRLDGHVLLRLRDVLIQLVRNAVAHGIEPEAERRAAGKPSIGHVSLQVERQGAHVSFRCQDDGRGIAADRLREAAVASGRLGAEEAAALDEQAALALVFQSGFTTERVASELAGRGVGLDVARETVRQLKGQIRLTSVVGRGTTIEATVPVSLAALPALMVEVQGLAFALPLEAVVGTFRLGEGAIARAGDRETVLFEGTAMPFVSLAHALGHAAPPAVATAVAVRVEGGRAALGVDRLLGTRDMVVRALPPVVGRLPLVTGASLDAEGTPLPLLDPAGLIAAAARMVAPAAVSARPLPILVIDDSLTTRMLEQSILESAGYEVDVAVSAEVGLEKAQQRRYGLFIVDVEMPGMNGFEFVERVGRDPRFHAIPAVLVTSRDAEADRRRGERAGAKAYIVKREFEQGRFLQIVRSLLG